VPQTLLRSYIFLFLTIGSMPLPVFAAGSVGLIQNGCVDKTYLAVMQKITDNHAASEKALDIDSEHLDLALFNVQCGLLGMIQFLIDIAGTVALFMFVYGGIQYFFSLRHPGQGASTENHATFYRAGMGLILMVMAHIIMNLIIGGFTSFSVQ